jgi:hypothetical protein
MDSQNDILTRLETALTPYGDKLVGKDAPLGRAIGVGALMGAPIVGGVSYLKFKKFIPGYWLGGLFVGAAGGMYANLIEKELH